MMNQYLVRIRSVYFAVDGTSPALAYWNAKLVHGPDLELVDWEPINEPANTNVVPIKRIQGIASPCQECLIYLSKCYCE